MVDLWTPGKTFFYGIVVGVGGTYLIMSKVPAYIDKKTEEIGEKVALKLKAAPNPGYNPGLGGCGEFGSLEPYSRLIPVLERMTSTLDRLDSRIDRLEKKFNEG